MNECLYSHDPTWHAQDPRYISRTAKSWSIRTSGPLDKAKRDLSAYWWRFRGGEAKKTAGSMVTEKLLQSAYGMSETDFNKEVKMVICVSTSQKSYVHVIII